MKKFLFCFGAAVLCSAVLSAADDKVRVTVTACVHQGVDPNSFVLTHVTEIWPDKRVPAPAIYWLSSTTQVKENVGDMVEVTGTYSPSRDAGKTGKIKVETDRAGEEKIAVEHGDRKAEATGIPAPVGTSGVKTEMKVPYRKLDVESLKPIGGRCQ